MFLKIETTSTKIMQPKIIKSQNNGCGTAPGNLVYTLSGFYPYFSGGVAQPILHVVQPLIHVSQPIFKLRSLYSLFLGNNANLSL